MITWVKALESENAVVDMQHKQIVIRFNKIVKAIEQTEIDKEFVGMLVEDLVSLVVYHFKTEEFLMKKSNYPKLEEHEKIHASFVKKVVEGKGDVGTEEKLKKFVDMVKEDLANHIVGHDIPMGEHLNKTETEKYEKVFLDIDSTSV